MPRFRKSPYALDCVPDLVPKLVAEAGPLGVSVEDRLLQLATSRDKEANLQIRLPGSLKTCSMSTAPSSPD